MVKVYILRDKEAGNPIDVFLDRKTAEKELSRYEREDKEDGTYTEDFYEIVESQIM